MEKRLFIVSNRLPVTVDEEKGLQLSSGGLVSAINGYMQNDSHQLFSTIFWAGVPGCTATSWTELMKNNEVKEYTYIPVFINPLLYNGYYNGHSNSMIWPLFHYFPSYAEYSIENYDEYQQANEQFLDTLVKYLRPTDTVWIHDYHLLPLAGLLRKAIPELTIGFFLHIPFPSYEVFRLMPRRWQEELLLGMLGADIVGFHTIDYASHFLQSVQLVLGLDNDQHILRHKNRIIKIDVFPISIEYELFRKAYDDKTVTTLRNSLRKGASGQQIIFSVDRLDYTKGVNNRLTAYEYFLLKNPQYREKVFFLLVVVPSRDNIARYAERKKMIDELISGINSRLGTIYWQPVIYQYSSLSFEEMIAYYTGCDLALITPLRDGMNLVAKEFVASRKDKRGVLVISEMAGAARELTDALTINPNDIVEIADKIKSGLEMPVSEQQACMERMQERIASYDVTAWTEDFFSALENIKKRQQDFQVKFLDDYSRTTLLNNYRIAKKRLLLLDYDGTLVPFSAHPQSAIPDKELIELLKLLRDENNDVFVVSGRNSAWLEKWFGNTNINLVAEHGARIKYEGQTWSNETIAPSGWKEPVSRIMHNYVLRCANSFIEEKEFSIVWHYRNAHPEQGKLRSSELFTELNDFSFNQPLEVLKGNKIIEVRNSGINKGTVIKKIIEKQNYDYILAIGDDATDEDMFKMLMNRQNSFTIKVGTDASFARYNLFTPQMVISLLERIAHIPVKEKKTIQ